MAEMKKEREAQQNLSSLFSAEYLIRKSAEQVKPQDLQGKIIGLYFSAHWCPPCRAFTPLLAGVYENLVTKGDFEIVFISADKDVEQFNEYHDTMPWLAVPFADTKLRENLLLIFEVEWIPYLVILGKDGNVLRNDGVVIVEEFKADAYPFTQHRIDALKKEIQLAKTNPTLESLLVSQEEGDYVISPAGTQIPVSELRGKTVALYLSAHCLPCRRFTSELVKVYNELRQKGEAFEVIFISYDRDEKSFEEYYSNMPWLALPYNNSRQRTKKIESLLEIKGIPSLIVAAPDGNIICFDAVEKISAYGARAYPFTDSTLKCRRRRCISWFRSLARKATSMLCTTTITSSAQEYYTPSKPV